MGNPMWDQAELIGKAQLEVVGLNDKLPAWHGLGIMPDQAYQWKTVSEGFEAAGMMYNLEMAPCYTEFNGQSMQVDGRSAVIREPSLNDTEPVVLDIVSNNYVLLQNKEIAERFDALCSVYKLATFGVLDAGRKVWVAFETSAFDIMDDPFRGFLIAFGHQAGSGSFKVFHADVRVVCANTLRRATESSTDMMTFAHKGRVKELVAMRAWAEQEVASARQAAVKEWELLAKTKLTQMQTAQIIEAAIPEPKPGKALRLADVAPGLLQKTLAQGLIEEAQLALDKGMASAQNQRLDIAMRLNKFNDEYPRFAGTAYAAVNAVTEAADWPEKPRSDTAQATLFGYRNAWKERAWKQAMSIAKNSN